MKMISLRSLCERTKYDDPSCEAHDSKQTFFTDLLARAVLRESQTTMGIRIMRLVTLWLVTSAEAFRVHGAATHAAKDVQGGGGSGAAAAVHRRGRKESGSKQVKETSAGAAKNVCGAGESPETCRALTEKYRGGGGEVLFAVCCCPWNSLHEV